MSAHILIVDDDELQRVMLRQLLINKIGCNVSEAASGAAALTYLGKPEGSSIELVVLDYMMPDMDGLQTLEAIHQKFPSLPVVMLTASTDVTIAIQAMKLGAQDYVIKPVDPVHFGITIQNALKIKALGNEVIRLKRQQDQALRFADLVGHNAGLREAVELGQRVAASEISVLITGETGVGKELFARALHGESARAGRPFVAVNCGSIPANLVESILFGHEKGAFTGAIVKTFGKFREAEGGTIFLDEVGELPLDTQVKLLRVLQEKEIEPVGGSKSVPVDVRIISATNRNLQQEVIEKRFREDLFFRLCAMPIHIKPLRERAADIPALVNHLLHRFAVEDRLQNKKIDKTGYQWLAEQSWSGNVRELENLIRRSMILDDDGLITADDLRRSVQKTSPAASAIPAPSHTHAYQISLLDAVGELKTMELLEQEIMALSLQHCTANVSKAARALGIAKSTFYRKFYRDTLPPSTSAGDNHGETVTL